MLVRRSSMITVTHLKQKSHGLKLRVQRGMIHLSLKSEQRNTNPTEWKTCMAWDVHDKHAHISTLDLYMTAVENYLHK